MPAKPKAPSSSSASNAKRPLAAASGNTEVPAKASKIEVGASGSLSKPQLPWARDKDKPAKEWMKLIVPWVNQELEKPLQNANLLQQGKRLIDMQPLMIQEEKGAAGTSYKQPWIPENCHVSMTKHGLYEAGAVLF